MKDRSEFKESTKQALAKRAGNSCSFPNCYAVTEGPSFESKMSISKTGMACHIYAAANGPSARRIKQDAVDEELSDISNGIWMCYSHGKLIDTDESTYTVEQLKTWKEVAEVRAQLWQQLGRKIELSPEHFINIPLPSTKIDFESLGQENKSIGEALTSACLSQIWGSKTSRAIRDALIEIVRNSFEHGKASKVTIDISAKSIKLIDDGTPYESTNLLGEVRKGGGFHSIDELVNGHNSAVYFSSHNDGNNNHHIFSVISSPVDITELTPCSIVIPQELLWGQGVNLSVAEFCKTVYVIFPRYFALSDAFKLPMIAAEYLPKNKNYVFVGADLSERAIELIQEQLGNVKIINYEL